MNAVGVTTSDERLTAELVLADRLGSKLTCEVVLRGLILAWFAPAATQFVLGATLLLGAAPEAKVRSGPYIELIWASIVLLAMPTLLVGLIWLVRRWPQLPTMRAMRHSWVHGVGATAAVVCIPLVPMMRTVAPSLLSVVLVAMASSAAVAASLMPRWLVSMDNPVAGPVAVFVGLVGWHLTVGWLHLMGSTLNGSVLLVVQGAALAISCVTAARVVPRLTASSFSARGSSSSRTLERGAEFEGIDPAILNLSVD